MITYGVPAGSKDVAKISPAVAARNPNPHEQNNLNNNTAIAGRRHTGASGKRIACCCRGRPPSTVGLVVDDLDEVPPEQRANFFKANGKYGLTQAIADKVVAHLGREA